MESGVSMAEAARGLEVSPNVLHRRQREFRQAPGNVRELENVVEHAVVLGVSESIRPEDLPAHIRQAASRMTSIGLKLPEAGIDPEQVEKEILLLALERRQWNQTRAARYLNLSRKSHLQNSVPAHPQAKDRPSGAKALIHSRRLTARLKSCPFNSCARLSNFASGSKDPDLPDGEVFFGPARCRTRKNGCRPAARGEDDR